MPSREEAGGQQQAVDYGLLLGWTHSDAGDRIALCLQSTTSPQADAVHEFRYFLTKSQAAVLGNFLFEVSGQAAPRRHRRSWFGRLIEGG